MPTSHVVYFVFLLRQERHGGGYKNLITGSAFLSKVNKIWSTDSFTLPSMYDSGMEECKTSY